MFQIWQLSIIFLLADIMNHDGTGYWISAGYARSQLPKAIGLRDGSEGFDVGWILW
jgi:hypothetical protein